MTAPAPAAPLPVGARCGLHPVRRAVDRCPVCARPRCAADAEQAPGGGCPACRGVPAAAATAPAAPVRERAVRGALAAHGAALLGGMVAAQYVDAQLFAFLTPFVVGVLTAAAAQSASTAAKTGREANGLRLLAATYAVVGVALGFALERSKDVLDPSALVPYAAAVLGVLVWTLPPKARARD